MIRPKKVKGKIVLLLAICVGLVLFCAVTICVRARPQSQGLAGRLVAPAWPASKKDLVAAGPASVEMLLVASSNRRELAPEVARNADEVIREMGGLAVPTILSKLYGPLSAPARDSLYHLDGRSFSALMDVAENPSSKSRQDAMMALRSLVAQEGSVGMLSDQETNAIANRLRAMARKEDRLGYGKSAASCLGLWQFDFGGYIQELAKSDVAEDRHTAAIACETFLNAKAHGTDQRTPRENAISKTLIDLLDDKNAVVAKTAAFGMRDIRLTSETRAVVRSKLEKLTLSTNAEVREAAFRSLRSVGGTDLRPIIRRLKKDQSEAVRLAANGH